MAIAGSDQAWTPEQKQAHEALWDVRKEITNRKQIAEGKPPLPDGPAPTGYVRLDQGTTAWDRAELMTAITGRQSEVRITPDDDQELTKGIFADKLAYDKPVLVGRRPKDAAAGEVELPHTLKASHVYEVTGLTSDGRIQLRNQRSCGLRLVERQRFGAVQRRPRVGVDVRLQRGLQLSGRVSSPAPR